MNTDSPSPTPNSFTSQRRDFDNDEAREWARWQRRNAASARRSHRQCRAVAIVVFALLLGWLAIELSRLPAAERQTGTPFSRPAL